MKDEMDILKEVSSIASAHGSRALSEMLKKKIKIDLPTLASVHPNQFLSKVNPEQLVISVQCRILSGSPGSIVLIFEEKSAFQLIEMCSGSQEKKRPKVYTEMGFSMLKEIGNVMVGSYAGALSIFLKTPIIPSIPTLINGPLKEIMYSVISPHEKKERILMIEANFEEVKKEIKGGLYLLLTPQAIKEIQGTCKKILEFLEK